MSAFARGLVAVMLLTVACASSALATEITGIVAQAKQLLRAGDAAGCVRVLQPIADVSAEDVEVLAVIGIAKNELRDYAGAAAALERAKAIDPETPEIRNQLGLAYAEMGDFARALPELEFVFGKAADTPDVGYRLGYIHYTETRYPPARDTLAENRPSGTAIEQRVYYLLGLTYERLGNRAESEKNLRKSILVDPATELARKIQAILDEDTSPPPAQARGSSGEVQPTAPIRTRRRKLGVDAFASLVHDGNARLDPKPNANDALVALLRARPGPRESSGFNLAVRPEYTFHDGPRARGSVSYTGSFTDHFQVQSADFSNQQIALNGFWKNPHRDGSPLIAAQLAFDDASLADVHFLKRYSLASSATWQSRSSYANVAFGQIQSRDFATDPVTVPQEVRDGTLLAVGGTHYRVFEGGRHNLRFGLQLDRDAADGADYAYNGVRPTIGVSRSISDQLVLSVDALHHRREYDNVNAVFGRSRRDADTLLLGRMSYSFQGNFTGFAELAHNDVHSNIPVFEYQRDTVSAGVHYRY